MSAPQYLIDEARASAERRQWAEAADALEQCMWGAWVGDREHRVRAEAWPDLMDPPRRPRPWGAWKRRREAA